MTISARRTLSATTIVPARAMSGRLRTIAAALALAAALFGCKPSIEGETKSFDQNKLSFQEFGGKFPTLKAALDARMAEAQQTFDAAKQLSDPDQRAEKMREANNLLTTMTSLFREIETKVRELDNLKRDPALLQLPGTMLLPAMQMSDGLAGQARAQLDQPATNAGELLGRLRDASMMLTRAREPLERIKPQPTPAPAPAGQPGQPAQPTQPGQQARPGQPGLGGAPGFGRPAPSPAPTPAPAPAPAH